MILIKSLSTIEKLTMTYIILINLFGFLTVLHDKRLSMRKRGRKLPRISEMTLLLIALAGGGLGCLMSIYTFNHKTNKLKFTMGMPIIILINIFAFILYLKFIISI